MTDASLHMHRGRGTGILPACRNHAAAGRLRGVAHELRDRRTSRRPGMKRGVQALDMYGCCC
jgi:hypothetical protein